MIVTDTDVISYFWLEAERTPAARSVREKDDDWRAPPLWQSEFRNVLYQHMAHRDLPLDDALQIADRVDADMRDATVSVRTADVLRLVNASGHSAYDCEYVALAQRLNVPLVTGDKRLPKLFPETAVLMEDFGLEDAPLDR
jgi:predicted nucleic acid-binding protein